MKKLYILSIVMLFCGICTHTGIFDIKELTHKKTNKKIIFLYDNHELNEELIKTHLLKKFVKLGNNPNIAVLFEDNATLRKGVKDSPTEKESTLSFIPYKLYSKRYKNFFYSDRRDKSIGQLTYMIIDLDPKQKIKLFCKDHSDIISDLQKHENNISLLTQKHNKNVQKQLNILLKKVKQATELLNNEFFTHLNPKKDGNAFYAVLDSGIACSLPEAYWLDKIIKLSKKHQTIIVYLGDEHCKNLIPVLKKCDYYSEKPNEKEKSENRLLSIKRLNKLFNQLPKEPMKKSNPSKIYKKPINNKSQFCCIKK